MSHVGALGPLGTDGGEIGCAAAAAVAARAGRGTSWCGTVASATRLQQRQVEFLRRCGHRSEVLFVKPGAEHRRFVAATGVAWVPCGWWCGSLRPARSRTHGRASTSC